MSHECHVTYHHSLYSAWPASRRYRSSICIFPGGVFPLAFFTRQRCATCSFDSASCFLSKSIGYRLCPCIFYWFHLCAFMANGKHQEITMAITFSSKRGSWRGIYWCFSWFVFAIFHSGLFALTMALVRNVWSYCCNNLCCNRAKSRESKRLIFLAYFPVDRNKWHFTLRLGFSRYFCCT